MINYVEEFEIAGTTYGIEAIGSGRYNVWTGGSLVGVEGNTKFESKEKARQYIFGHAETRVESALRTARASVAFLEEEQRKMGGDVFNLGRFRKD
jgi:hypothetical protein